MLQVKTFLLSYETEMISHQWLWGLNSAIKWKLVTAEPSIRSDPSPSDRMVTSWPDPTDPDAGSIRSVGWCLEEFSWLFFVVLRCMRCSFFMARLYSLELDISLINLRRNLVFIKSFCACAVSFFLDLPKLFQRAWSLHFFIFSSLFPVFGYICMHKHFSMIK